MLSTLLISSPETYHRRLLPPKYQRILKSLGPWEQENSGGVGPKTEAYLKGKGIQTIGELASLPLQTLIEWFGKSFGEYLYEASRGIDESPIVTHWEPKSMSRETTFEEDVADRKVVEETLAGLTGDVVSDLHQRGYKGKTVTVKVRFNNFETHTKAKTPPEMTDSLEEIGRVAAECLQRFEFKKKVRLIGIRVGGLQKLPNPAGDVDGEGKKML